MNLQFDDRVKHGKIDFHPGVTYAFEDPDAVPYFVAAFGAKKTKDAATVTIGLDEIDIDPETIFGSGERKGEKVLAPTKEA